MGSTVDLQHFHKILPLKIKNIVLEHHSVNADGSIISSPEELAQKWHDFLCDKFAPTDKERARPPLPPLPTTRTPEDNLTREEFDKAVDLLKINKAV